MSKVSFLLLLSLISLEVSQAQTPVPSAKPLLEVLVTGDTINQDLTTSLENKTVLSAQTIKEAESQHFQDLLESVPNLNWAAGSNRPRFLQIRGIGEREQYEGAPNSSVAFLIDDIDLSSLGTVGSLFDMEEVKVLRGPQGFGFGPSALAGLVQLKTKDPTPYYSSEAEFSMGNDGLVSGGAVISGPLTPDNHSLQFRLAAFDHHSDGFRHDQFLSRDDTNKRDELTTRAKLRWLPSNDVTLDFEAMHLNANDGYDAFAIDNSFTTQSDRPGKDKQTTDAGSIKLAIDLGNRTNLITTSTLSRSDLNYSYDGDWGNNPFWGANAPYDYFSQTLRTRRVASHELRLLSNPTPDGLGEEWNWLFGIYQQRLKESGAEHQFQDAAEYDDLESKFGSKINAAFGAVDIPLVEKTAFTLGARAEDRNSTYQDSRAADFTPNEEMYGLLFGLKHELSSDALLNGSISRGYKGGGFNTGFDIPSDKLTFKPENLWNFELGAQAKFLDQKLITNLSVFHTLRRNEQAKISIQNNPNDPLSFTYITENAARGHNTGLEYGASFQATEKLALFSNGALLTAKFDNYNTGSEDLSGRDQSHAPNWQHSTGLHYQFTDNFFTRIEVTGKDGFYFDDNNNQTSKNYHLTNLTFGYKASSWSFSIWAHNLFNQTYDVRGFYFGDEPPDFPNKRYVQLGDPIQFGSTISFFF